MATKRPARVALLTVAAVAGALAVLLGALLAAATIFGSDSLFHIAVEVIVEKTLGTTDFDGSGLAAGGGILFIATSLAVVALGALWALTVRRHDGGGPAQ